MPSIIFLNQITQFTIMLMLYEIKFLGFQFITTHTRTHTHPFSSRPSGNLNLSWYSEPAVMLSRAYGQACFNPGPQLLHLEHEVRMGNGVGPGKVTGSFWLWWSICLFCHVLRTSWWNNQTLRLLWVIWILTWTRELTPQVSHSRDCGASPLWDMGAEWTWLGLCSWTSRCPGPWASLGAVPLCNWQNERQHLMLHPAPLPQPCIIQPSQPGISNL